MKTLVVSDEVAPQIYDAGTRSRFSDVELVLSCGDVPHYYLEYIVGTLDVPLLYVMGNHGYELEADSSPGPGKRPGGCTDIHGRVVRFQGLLIAGLEGSMRYKHLEEHISVHRYYLGLESKAEVAWTAAAGSWHDNVYLPVVQIIRERQVLNQFPGRTETDLYLWIMEHRYYLSQEYGSDVGAETATRDFVSHFGGRGLRRRAEHKLQSVKAWLSQQLGRFTHNT